MKHVGRKIFGVTLSLFLTTIAINTAHADAGSVKVGDPSSPSSLSKAIQDAYNQGAHNIVINKGTYLLSDSDSSALQLNGWKNVTISAYDTTLIMSNPSADHSLITLDGCSNVTVEGGLLSQDAMTAYQGRIVAVHKDRDGAMDCDWQSDSSYPLPSDTARNIDAAVVDSQTMRLHKISADFTDTPVTSLGGGKFQFHFLDRRTDCKVGDWIVGRIGDAPSKVVLTNCHNCTIQDVVMTHNGSSVLVEQGGGGNHYLNLEMSPGTRPEGATEDPLVDNSGHGMVMTGASPGPDIQDCTFKGVSLNDCIEIHDALLAASSSSASDPQLGYRVVNCQIGGSTERGIRADRNDGYILKNTIENCRQAISLGPEGPGDPSRYVENVTIQGNTIRRNQEVAIMVHGDNTLSNRNITISGNMFLSNYGNEVMLQGLSGATMADNVFTGVQTWQQGMRKQSVITVTNSTNITLSRNTVNNPWSYDPALVNVGDNVTALTNNDSTGIRKIKNVTIATVAGDY